MSRLRNYLPIFKKILAHKKILCLAVFVMVVMALTLPLFPFVVNQNLPKLFLERDQAAIELFSLVLVGLVGIRSIANCLHLYATKMICAKVCLGLRVALFDKLCGSPTGQSGLNQNNLPARFIQDVNLATETAMRVITILVKDGLAVVGLTVCMLYLNWELGLFILLIAPIVILIEQFICEYLSSDDLAVTQSFDTLTENIKRTIQQFRVIRVYGGQSNACKQFQKKSEQCYASESKQISSHALIVSTGQLMVGLIAMAAFAWAIQMVNRNDVTLAELFALSIAVLLIITPLRNIFRMNSLLAQGQAAVDRIYSILHQENKQDMGIYTVDGLSGSLALEQVCVHSGGTQKSLILSDIDLVIRPGEITAVVNATYNERHVIIDLMLGMQSPSTGKVQLDGYNIETIKQSDLFDQFSIISSDEVLLDETIATNIAYGGMYAASESEIVAAAHTALAMEFIREMPDGLQTKVGMGEQQLTSIQIQQLAIARGVLKNSTILILNGLPDHMVSSTDSIFIGLNALMRNRSTLVFTENQFMLEKANRIIVFDSGRIVETGTHQNLLSRQSKYAQIIQARLEAGGMSGVTL